MRKPRQQHCFNFIELLVVVGIVVLMPDRCVRGAPQEHSMLESIVAYARDRAVQPILTRPRVEAEIPEEFRLPGMAHGITGHRRELFCTAMADFLMCLKLADELPLMAIAATDGHDPAAREFVLKQLDEMAAWHPLNRPGWTLYAPGDEPLADFNDGNWLGTGTGIRAIVDTMSIMGEHVPPPLRHRLHKLLAAEVASVRDDFRTGRPWYHDTPVSNQFVLPNIGVVLATLELGNDRHTDDYEFGVRNVLRTLDTQGRDGANHEGGHYGAFMTREILYAAMIMAEHGDHRLIDHPHLAHFGGWLGHLIQPGGRTVNAFDGSASLLMSSPTKEGKPKAGHSLLDSLMLAAMAPGADAAHLRGLLAMLPTHAVLSSTAYRYARFASENPDPAPPIPPWASYSSSPLVTWRSGWNHDATGVWVRGGAPADSHDHRDHGHVNYIFRGEEILIEAGSSDYGDPQYEAHYTAGSAHNVLQIGDGPAGAQLKGPRPASIQVHHLDKDGGDVTVDPTPDYDPKLLKQWQRRVIWNSAGLTINDEVTLPATAPNQPLFYFHLARKLDVQLRPSTDGKSVDAAWQGGAIRFQADAPLDVSTQTVIRGISWTETADHTCLLVRSREPVRSLRLSTSVQATPNHQ